ncbi:GNAT family N-acetyltransferase [Nakamurella sp. A5-74]|uniref:GNAT family N-acetyltransferase n=1 Tax=Nakamurella sp. A5-74 TaxID=3158264 RepID=A0AAU8DNZ1_9ACTN
MARSTPRSATSTSWRRTPGSAPANGVSAWRGDRLVGYVDADPDNDDGLQPDDVNIGYAVHPWARGSGVAVEAVALICGFIRDHALGSRAAIRVEPENEASIRVAEKAGFSRLDDFVSATDTNRDGSAVVLRLYVREL